MDLFSNIAVGVVFLFILYLWVSAFYLLLSKVKVTYKVWASYTVKILLFWGVVLIIETFWWFWPEGIAHQLAMGLGGLFGVYWGLAYLFIPKQ